MIIKFILFLSISFLSSFSVFNLVQDDFNNALEDTIFDTSQNDISDNLSEVKSDKVIQNPTIEKEIFLLEIPKINVENKVYGKDSHLNNIDKNVQLMSESDLPDVNLGNVIIGGHSGTGPLAYFKNLHLLNLNDEIIIKYNNNDYLYYIKKIYTDDKNGSIVIRRNYSKDTLTLFTCNPNDKDSYLIIIAEKM